MKFEYIYIITSIIALAYAFVMIMHVTNTAKHTRLTYELLKKVHSKPVSLGKQTTTSKVIDSETHKIWDEIKKENE